MNSWYPTTRMLRFQHQHHHALVKNVNKCSFVTMINSKNNFQSAGVGRGTHHRLISTRAAFDILELSHHSVNRLTPKELRRAYIKAAKKHHPDSQQQRQPYHTQHAATASRQTTKIDVAKQFRLVTEAFELLQEQQKQQSFRTTPFGRERPYNNGEDDEDDWGISDIEENEFRRACTDILGLDAEIVEESKQCPAFRHWLQGKTDGALYWQMFFLKYGGLAPMLKPKKDRPVALLNTGEIGRRRKKR